jgi:outer membrane protein assembly factor BamB
VQFTISAQAAPTIAALSPSTAIAGAANFQLVVTGTNFAPGAMVLWNGRPIPTTYDSATQLTAEVTFDLVASVGNVPVTVVNDAAAGGTSNVSQFAITAEPPVPTLTSLSPNSTTAGNNTINIVLTGTGFTPTTLVQAGNFLQQPTFISSTQISLQGFSVATYGGSTISFSVVDPASGFIPSNTLNLALTPAVPATSGVTPSMAFAQQGGLSIAVSGQFFSPTSVVYFNGSARPTALNNNTGQLVAQLSAADLATQGTETITVEDPLSGNVPSNSVSFVVQPLPPLALTSLSPATVPAGNGKFTLTVLGNGFTVNSKVELNNVAAPTTYVSISQLRATVTAAQVASVGTRNITVFNSAGAGGTSSALTLNIVAPSIDAVSYQITNGHSGAITFNAVSLPAAASWSVNLGGPPSYALIVANRVYVVANVNGNGELFALNGTTGATLWGPIAFSGGASITYDAGAIFVNSGAFATNGVVSALDAVTGNPKWSATIPGEFATQAPPVAQAGNVYTLEDGVLTAFNETTGAQQWQSIATGTDGTVAVTVDGVYTAAPCTPNAFEPFDGSVIWSANTGCEGGGGATPVVASGRDYAPIGVGGYSGDIYSPEDGTLLGAFNYSGPPAVTATNAFTLFNSTLQGVSLSNNQINWSFAGDGMLTASPIVVNNFVFVGSSSGNLYAVDATTGAQLWTKNLGAAIFGSMNAGDGLLIVPAGNTVTAYVLSTNP